MAPENEGSVVVPGSAKSSVGVALPGLEGVLVRGVFGGVGASDDGRFTFLTVSCHEGGGDPRVRRIDYSPFDPQTGRPTLVEGLVPGVTRVEVSVFVDARRMGKFDSFATLRLRELRVV